MNELIHVLFFLLLPSFLFPPSLCQQGREREGDIILDQGGVKSTPSSPRLRVGVILTDPEPVREAL